jgi:hypothetical protein
MPDDVLPGGRTVTTPGEPEHRRLSLAQQERLDLLRGRSRGIGRLASGPGGTLEATVSLRGGVHHILLEDPDELLDRIEQVIEADRGVNAPSAARIYDYLLGGHDNLAADREVAGRLLDPATGWPGMRSVARQNRLVVTRMAGWASARGIGQYLDLGAGLPPPPPFHPVWETVRQRVPGACVVSVDSDPVVSAAVQALGDDGATAAVTGDLADPAAVTGAAAEYLDFSRPAAVMLMSVLSFWSADEARRICRGYITALAPGSVLVISCGRADDPVIAEKIITSYTARGLHNHTAAEVTSFFGGTALVSPGVMADRGRRGEWRYLSPEDPLCVLYGAGIV